MSSNYPFDSGPIAPERNPPINPEYYSPPEGVISAMVLGVTTTITTENPNQFVVGQLVRLIIPWYWGPLELNGKTGYISQINSDTQFVAQVYSQGLPGFALSPFAPLYPQSPQVLPIGDINTGTINQGRTSNGTFIPGSFINISPN